MGRENETLLYEIKDKLEASNGLLTLSEIEIFDKLYDDILYIAVMENPSTVIDNTIIGKKRGRKANIKPRNLVNRLIDYKESILLFMIDPSVPFTNNSAERDLRIRKYFKKYPVDSDLIKGLCHLMLLEVTSRLETSKTFRCFKGYLQHFQSLHYLPNKIY